MIAREHPLLLGSASPRRREILEQLRLPIRIVTPSIDERATHGEGADAYLERIVEAKLVGAAALSASVVIGGVLVADTIVLVDDAILGKPADDAEARSMLARLSGRTHEVCSRFAIASPQAPARALAAETVRTKVTFRELAEDEVARYVATGEGRDKAGSYAIQGIGTFAVAQIEGSYSNVVGLPAAEVVAALLRAKLLEAFPLVDAR
jgi:septum formation protein